MLRLMQVAWTLLAVVAALSPGLASAQAARARVRQGAVDGVEMQLDGSLSVAPGERLRWLVTAYEVRGLSELAPAAGATVHVAASYDPTQDAVEVTTDASGRALVELAVPLDVDPSFTAILRLVHANGIQRRYELPVSTRPPVRVDVFVDRPSVEPRGTVRIFGRVRAASGGRPLADEAVEVTLEDPGRGPILAPLELTTDASGVFSASAELPEEHRGALRIRARVERGERPVVADAMTEVREPAPRPIYVAVAPAQTLVAPGTRVPLEVVVRGRAGRPIEGATVTLDGAQREDPDRRAVTDGRGRARLSWLAPRRGGGSFDFNVTVSASKEGVGRGDAGALVRVGSLPYALAYAVEGGALSDLGGDVFARVVGPDGRPAGAGVEVRASGSRFSPVRGTTDASGVAVLHVALDRAPDPSDRCGGQTSTAIALSAGTAELDGCLMLDPDAAARVRVAAPEVRPGHALDVTVDRAAAARAAPVALSVLTAERRVVAYRVLGPNETAASIAIPEDADGLLTVRARPLIGAARQPVRGGVVLVWARPAPRRGVSADLSPSGRVTIGLTGAEAPGTAVVVASEIAQASDVLQQVARSLDGPLARLSVGVESPSPDFLRGALAASAPGDDAAPAVLRGGRVIDVPAPASPVAAGLLRDPWRSRARFVEGRLALLLRALEQTVAAALPERIDDVAVQVNGRYRFNDQVLEAVAQSGQVGAEGATGLGGDPLTIDQLRRFDAQIDYDHVARRITRERLFRLILSLRGFVHGQGFDLPWSRLGDPSEWMPALMGRPVPGGGPIARGDLVDGWGRPFEIRPARGGRARFSFVDALGTWEIVSAGPDGRFGTGDDQHDPTARVLRSGSAYADAVGEDLLLGRLQGTELARASIALLRNLVPAPPVNYLRATQGGAGAPSAALWTALPSVLEPLEDPLALRREDRPGPGAAALSAPIGADGTSVALTLDEEPRTWGAVVFVAGEDGSAGVALARSLAGSRLIVEGEIPPRVRTGEPVSLDLVVTNVSDEVLPVRLEAVGDGLTAEVPDELTVPAGGAAPVAVRLRPDGAAGRGGLTLRFLRGDEAVRTVRADVQRVTGDHPLRLRAAGLARGATDDEGQDFRVRFTVPSDARRASGRVVLLSPGALGADPDLADVRDRDPALVAFASALAGRALDPATRARLLRRQDESGLVQGDDPALSSACAAAAWASADEDDEETRRALARLRAAMGRLGAPSMEDPAEVRRWSAVLGALAAGGVPTAEDVADPVAATARGARVVLRATLRSHPDEPSLLARAAAALLLADPREVYGRAMLERARESLRDVPGGGARVVPSDRLAGELESLAATAALAVAAHQVGDLALADRLARGALARDHVATRAGGETLFWLLASGAYGALGVGAERVEVTVDGARQEVDLSSGRAVLALAPRAGDHEVRVTAPAEGAAFVRVEAAMERPFTAREGPYALALEGDAGDVATGAAFELSVTAREAVARTVVDISLPAGATLDPALRRRLASVGPIRRVEEREPGFLRVELGPLAEGVTATLPLPLRWSVRGTLRGLGAVAYPLGRPEAMSALAPRDLTVR